MSKLRLSLVVAGIAFVPPSHAVMIGGVEFPDGATSFADEAVEFSPGPDVEKSWLDPTNALGVPDSSGTSLGDDGSLTLQFTDNALTTSGDSNEDLWVFEGGPVVENFGVAVSTDNSSWIDLGVVSGQPSGIDLDAVAGVTQGASYSYVKLTDAPPNQSGLPYGEADIDAVGAISSAPPVNSVPEPGSLALFGLGLTALGLGSRRRG